MTTTSLNIHDIGSYATRNVVSAYFSCRNLSVGCVIVINTTFNNISVISWQSVLLPEETRENHQPAASYSQTLSHNVVSSIPRHEQD
jgi:hypothetical protein